MIQKIADALVPFSDLFHAFESRGFKLYAVGGCVRDWLMDRPPKDIDFTTDARPEQTKEILAQNGWKVIPVGELFGTIATIIHKKQYEITTFRVRESYTRGSRHPIVCYGKALEADLVRRDLTINAMAADSGGNLIDPFDGRGDIERKILRVPHSSYDQTVSIFSDDPLRMLRLARFMARFDFQADPCATRAATDMAGSILTVSHERWFSELDGLLRSNFCEKGLQWLWKTGILPLIMPEFCALEGCLRRPISLAGGVMTDDARSCLDRMVDRIKAAPADGDFRWVACFDELGNPASAHADWALQTSQMIAEACMQRLKFASARIDSILKMMSRTPACEPNYRNARKFAISLGGSLRDWMKYQEIRWASLPEAFQAQERDRLAQWKRALSPYLDDPASAEVALPKNLSQAISQTLGVRGKTLGLCLAQCREAVLDEYLHETDDCDQFVAWVRDHFS